MSYSYSSHLSTSKGASSSAALTSANRTYDAKLVQREMLRLGTLAGQLPAAALSTITGSSASALNSASTLVFPHTAGVGTAGAAGAAHGHGHALGHALGHGHGGSTSLGMGMNGNDGGAWAQLHIYVLPLFNHEQLQFPIEDLNALVRRHIEAVMSAGPSRALATLEIDVAELIGAGMTTLNTKLAGVEDDKLPARVVELWTFFWDQVLPYVEGVFIPLQTDPLLLALYRTPKSHRPTSPTTLASPEDTLSGAAALSAIDVRAIALRAFRDKIIVPVAPCLEARLVAIRPGSSFSSSTTVPGMSSVAEATSYQHPRLQQMLLVLHSQAQRARPALSLSAPAPSLSPQEHTIRRLLDALAAHRAPLAGSSSSRNSKTGGPLSPQRHRRAPSFLSGGAPRDRRGRIGIGLNAGADSDKENAKRRGRYINIDDVAHPTPPAAAAAAPSGSANTYSSSYTVGENGSVSKGRFRSYYNAEWDEEGEWEVAYGREARGGGGSGGDGGMGMETGSWDGEMGGGMTPRGRFSAERERDRSFLESLRSPNPFDAEHGHALGSPYAFVQNTGAETNGGSSASARESVNTIGRRDDSLLALPPPEHDVFSSSTSSAANANANGGDEHLDWDSAQAVVERMVGMGNAGSELDHGDPSATHVHLHSHTPSPAPGQGPGPPAPDSRRRRMT